MARVERLMATAIAIVWSAAAFAALAITFAPVVVRSNSMAPGISRGDLLLTTEVPAEAVRAGDVVTRTDGHVAVTHRVVEVERAHGGVVITTKGDANATADPVRLHAGHTIRRAVRAVPLAGYPALLVSSPWLRLSLLVIPALGLLSLHRREALPAAA